MATELDALQLNFTASTSKAISSIDNLAKKLRSLGDSFGVFSKVSDYSSNIGNMASAMETLSNSINSIDSRKFKDLSSSIKGFVKASESLSNFNGFNAVQKSADGVSTAVKKVADEFAKQWGVNGKNATEQLTSAIEKMYNGLEDGTFASASKDVQNLVKQFADLSAQIGETNTQWKEVRKWISSSNIALPDMTSEWGDDYKRNRGILGIKNTTTGTSRQGDFSEKVAEMNRALGTTFDVTKTEQDLLNDIVQYIERGKESTSELAKEFWNVQENSRGLMDSIHGLVGSLADIQENAQNINNSFSSIESSPLDNIVSGLESISGVTIPDFTNLTVFASGISKIGGESGTKAKENLIPIAEGLKAFQGINIPQLEGITEFANGLRALGSKTIVNASSALKPIADALRQFPTEIPAISGLTELAQSLSLFGRKTAQQAVETIPRLAKAFRELIVELSSAPSVSRNLVNLTDALARFVTNVNRVGSGSVSASKGLNLFGNTASRVSKKTFSLASAIGKVYATYFLLFRAFGKIRDSINISSQLKEVQNVVDTTFGDMTDKVEEFAQSSIKNFGLSELSAKQYSSRFQAMGVAMGITSAQVTKAQESLNAINPTMASRGYNDLANSMADVSINVTKLAADMASFYNVSQEDVAKDLEAIYTGMTRPLRKYGLDLTEATLKEWAMKNGLDANIKSMTQAEKTMLRYQYVMANTSASQGDFAKTSLTWANQIRMLGQNFQRLGAVIGSGFIAWLRPLVVTINSYMDSIIASVQRVVNAIGKIFGWQMIVDTTGEQLIDDTEGVADAWDDATGAAKKYAKQLLGIDELNNLTTQDNSGSGADSGLVGGLSGGNIIQPGGISFEKFESDIDNLYDLGKKISDKLKDMLSGIDWQSIYDKASNFGSGLADFLNGLFQPETFYQTGRAIAGALNTAINVAFGLGTTFDWENLGKSIGERINGFFDEFDFAKLAQTLNVWVKGLWTAFKEAVSTIEWTDVFAKLYDFVSELNVGTVALIIGAITIKKIGKLLIGFLFQDWIGKALSKAIGIVPIAIKGIKVLSAGGLIEGGGFFAKLANAIALTVGGAGTLHEAFVTMFGGIATAVMGVASAIGGAILSVKSFFDMWKNGWSVGKEILKDIGIAVTAVGAVILGVAAAPAAIVAGIVAVGSSIAIWAHDNWDAITETFSKLGDWFKEHVTEPLVNLFKPFTDTIAKLFEGAWIIIKATWILVKDWFNQKVILPIKTVFTIGISAIKVIFTNLWNDVKAIWSVAYGWFDQKFITPLKLAFFTVSTAIKEVFDGIWNNIKGGAQSLVNGIISLFEFGVNGIINTINGFFSLFNKAVSFASTITGDNWDGIDLIQTISIPRVNFFKDGGFPNQGSLFVAGETYGQSEWVGNINGRTGVVSPSEITGIADAIYQTSAEEMSMLRQQVNLLSGILEKEFGISTNDIGKAARSYGRDYYNRTGNNAYVF